MVVFGPLKNYEKVEDIKGVFRFRKPKRSRQYNGQMKNNKRKKNDIQNITRKNEEQATRIPLKCGDELRFPERLSVPAPPVIPVIVLLNDTNII